MVVMIWVGVSGWDRGCWRSLGVPGGWVRTSSRAVVVGSCCTCTEHREKETAAGMELPRGQSSVLSRSPLGACAGGGVSESGRGGSTSSRG